ncbi:maternal effect embryoarrest 60 [Gossypium australe]|uniref:Maternal effect embryoarrest 60 n=1 Tax=Gossypium australe TaxID=47621 RepID=A0A5B6UR15_9ROSI|nr:maternal effect embryoarrest 60 [Gossypium australe]
MVVPFNKVVSRGLDLSSLPSLEHLILKSHSDKHSGLPYVRVSAFDRFSYWTPSKVSGPPVNPPSNPFGNAFYSVGSGLNRGGLGKHEFSDLQFLFPLNPNNTNLAIRIAQQNSEGHWTITEPVGGQHSYKLLIYGICYELGPYRHLIRLSPEGPVSQSSAAVRSNHHHRDHRNNDGNPAVQSRRLTSTPSSSSSSSKTSVHVTALDGLVNVNSLFTVAVFVGLSLTTPGQHSLENRAPCDAGADVAKKLLVFEVVSFSFFLFSSLVAQGLKLAINLLNSKDVDEAFRAHINLKVLRFGMMGSAVGSVMGSLFLMLSMVNVIEIRLGMLSCGSKSSVHAAAALVVLVSSALLVYISTAVYAFLH